MMNQLIKDAYERVIQEERANHGLPWPFLFDLHSDRFVAAHLIATSKGIGACFACLRFNNPINLKRYSGVFYSFESYQKQNFEIRFQVMPTVIRLLPEGRIEFSIESSVLAEFYSSGLLTWR